VPAVIASDDPFLARAALALIRTWRYEPPVHRGESVLVEDRKTLTFAAGSASGDR
jgi:outer membrane biosynthesis protein TonB